MSKWNRPMRQYTPIWVPCKGCGRTVGPKQEARMVGGDVYHVLCAPQPQPSPELAARIAGRRKS